MNLRKRRSTAEELTSVFVRVRGAVKSRRNGYKALSLSVVEPLFSDSGSFSLLVLATERPYQGKCTK